MNSHLLRPKQAADWLGVSLSTFYKRVKQGLIPPAAYRQGNSIAWESSDLKRETMKFNNLTEKDNSMYQTHVRAVAPYVLKDLLAGNNVSHASFAKYSKYGANTNMTRVVECLKTEYKVAVKHTRKNGGSWFMNPQDIVEYTTNPSLHCAQTEQAAKVRSRKLLENKVAKIVEENKPLLLEVMRSKLS